MVKDQTPKFLELRNGEIRGLNSSETFISIQAYSHMCLIDHGYIVVSISNCHCQQTAVVKFDHADHVSLLFWRNSAADYSLACLTYPDEFLTVLLFADDKTKCLCLDHQSSALVLCNQLFISLQPLVRT